MVARLVGLNEDADLLLNKVILDEERQGLSLAAIVGMGGIGKSTLARKIYNHPAIAYRFEKRAWVVVSNEFAAEDIMKQIMQELSLPLGDEELKALESIKGNLRRQEMLQQMLRKRLQGKRYFIVLDDVWKHTHWDALQTAFPDEKGRASRLMFTSRNRIITERHGYVHKMKLLNSDESWELLLKTALISRKCPQELEDIGREMLKKCQGLPLAITVAGGLLVNQGESKTGWYRVLNQIKNYHLETSEIGNNVSAILELSYQNLPSKLKPCILCLSFFKEDAVIRAKKLVHIWVALGLVQAGEGSVEETAMDYLDELINRNLVLVKDMSIDDRVKYFYVHDLLHQLSIRKAKEEIGFESLVSDNEQGSSSSSCKPRHRDVRGSGKMPIWIESSKHLRSLFVHVDYLSYKPFTSPSYWKSFELLRILDIEGRMLVKLPSQIRALIGIRYLRLRDEHTVMLPSWLDVLKNLEVIDVADCPRVRFPNVTWKMDSLRHFYIHSGCIFSNPMKQSIWKNLETLKEVSSYDLLFGDAVQRFGRLRKLGVRVEEMNEKAETLWERFLVESVVQVLHLRLDTWREGDLPIPNSMGHLTKLKLHGSLFSCPSAFKLPQNITHLTLSDTGITINDPMQELGKLPNLLVLKLIYALCYTESIKVSRDGFPRLKALHLTRMRLLTNIEIQVGGMAELQRLEIHESPNLQTQNHLRSAEIIHHH